MKLLWDNGLGFLEVLLFKQRKSANTPKILDRPSVCEDLQDTTLNLSDFAIKDLIPLS